MTWERPDPISFGPVPDDQNPYGSEFDSSGQLTRTGEENRKRALAAAEVEGNGSARGARAAATGAPLNPLTYVVGFLGLLLAAHWVGPWAVTTVKYAFVAWVVYVFVRGIRFLMRHPLLSVAWVVCVLVALSLAVWMNRNFTLLPGARVFIEPIDQMLRLRGERSERIAARVEFLSKTVNATSAQRRELTKIVDYCDSEIEVTLSLGMKEKVRELNGSCAASMREVLGPEQKPAFDKLMAEIMPGAVMGESPK